MNSPLNPPAPHLELFVLQHRGREIDFSWQWPAATIRISFADVLSALDDVDAEFMEQARAFTLQRTGSAQQTVWHLGNGSKALQCSVNARVLPTACQQRLSHGDEIEMGLMRLLVSLESAQERPALLSQEAPQATSPAAQDMAGFALTDLDATSATAALANPEQQGLKKSDFGDLIALNPEDHAALSSAKSSPAKATDPQPPASQPAPARPAGAEEAPKAPSYAEKVSGLLAQFQEGAQIPDAADTPMADPLVTLHGRYLDKLRNPTLGDAGEVWQDKARGGPTRQVDPMQQWMNAAGKRAGLDDLLGQPHSIASVMDGLDPMGSSDVLAPEPFDSVMQLFAPDNLRTPEQTRHTQPPRSLPTLTQREHHSMSVDSAMPFVAGEKPPTPQP